ITVDRQMKRYRVPRIAFVNKMDRAGANYYRVAAQLKEKLGHHAVTIQVPIEGKAFYFDGDNGEEIREEPVPPEYVEKVKEARHEIVEKVAEVDDVLA